LTVFVTWLKTRRRERGGLAVLAVACALLGACSQPKADGGVKPAQPTPPRPPAAQAPAPSSPAKPALATGFTPLPSANQVIAAVSTGRADPFAPGGTPLGADGGPAKPPAPLTLPAGFRFSGVIRSGSRPQALVQIGDQTGPICPGPRGACPGSGLEALLPAGWSVAAIDVDRGRLTLRQGKQSITAEL